jgi:hypothetical protein
MKNYTLWNIIPRHHFADDGGDGGDGGGGGGGGEATSVVNADGTFAEN